MLTAAAALRQLDPATDDLLALLKQHFTLTPNYPRALDGRIVDTKFDPATGGQQPVTDHDLAAAYIRDHHYKGVYGDRIRQTWTFHAADGTKVQYNATWRGCRYFGLEQASTCQSCQNTRWNRFDRRQSALCEKCRLEEVTRRTGRCYEEGSGALACSTCYVKRGCRCADCLAWKTGHDRRRREARNSVSATRTLQEKTYRPPASLPVGLTELRHRTTESEVATWTWLPADVRAVVGEYAARFNPNQEGQHGSATQGAVGRRDRQRQADRQATVRRTEKRPRPRPRGKANLQVGLPVLLARGPVAEDGTIWVDLPGGPVRMVAA